MTRALWVLALLALGPSGALAHTLDEYLQAARLSLTRSQVSLDLDLTPGAMVAARIVAMIDRDQDGVISPAEAAAYATRVLNETAVELDGAPVPMTVTRVEAPPIGELREGMGTINIRAVGVHRTRLAGRARLSFRNDHAPDGSVYVANALVPADRRLSVSRQDRDVAQRSIDVFYDVGPTIASQVGWTAFAVVTGLTLVARRRGQRRMSAHERNRPYGLAPPWNTVEAPGSNSRKTYSVPPPR